MREAIRLALERLCRRVECTFPGVICACAGFAQARMPTEDEDVVAEVFFAPAGSSRAIARATHEDARRLWRQYGVSVAFVAHYPEDTLRYYKDDVLAMISARYLSLSLDPAGFHANAMPLAPYWAGSACGIAENTRALGMGSDGAPARSSSHRVGTEEYHPTTKPAYVEARNA